MLTTHNQGKYLSQEWIETRNRAIENKEDFTEAELSWLEIIDDEGTGKYQDRTYLINTSPLDPDTSPVSEAIDIRKRPQCGD